MSTYIKLDSKHRSSGKSHDFIINIPQHLRAKRLRLAYANIPISFYNVNESNNKVYIQEGGGVIQGSIPIGNYNLISLQSALQNTLNDITTSGVYNVYTVSINPLTNKMSISAGSNWRFYNDTNKGTYPNSIHKIIGFDSNTVDNYNTSFEGYDMVNVNIYDSLHVLLGEQTEMECLNNEGFSLLIPITGNQLDYILYSPKETFQQYITFPQYKNVIKVQVKSNFSNDLLDLNGLDWYMVFEVFKD